MKIISFYRKISNIGISSEMMPDEKKSIGLINRYSILMISMMFVSIFIAIFTGYLINVVLKLFAFTLIFSFLIILNLKKKYNTAKHIFVSITVITNTLGAIATNRDTAFIIFIFLSVLLPVLIFKQRRTIYLYYLINILCFIFIVYYHLYQQPFINLPEEDLFFIYFFGLFIGFYMIMFPIVMFYRGLNKDYEIKLIEKNKLLQQQKDEIETQRDSIFKKNVLLEQQNEEITAQRDKINSQHKIVVRQKKDITDSIQYAKRIQTAVLPTNELLNKIIPEHFVLFKPRDIVSGDFYYIEKIKENLIIAAVDCTGHGVPGAFLSMLGFSFLNEIIHKNIELNAGIILDELRIKVKKSII